MQQHCSSESRAFFIIDSLTDGCWVWAQKALLRLGSTLAVALKQPTPLGVAVLQRSKPGQATQLQVSAVHVLSLIVVMPVYYQPRWFDADTAALGCNLPS